MNTREVQGARESASRSGVAPQPGADGVARDSREGAEHLGRACGQDRFGRAVAARLQAGADDLPYEVRERLRAARTQALARRKREAVLNAAPGVQANGGAATLGRGGGGLGWWGRIASALPLLALAAGLVLLHSVQGDERAAEIAEVDAALLTDDLPPAAYADPGFVQFLKLGRE